MKLRNIKGGFNDMAMNPADMMKMMGAFKNFQEAHPKAVSFFQVVFGSGIPADTVMELTVTKPGEQPMTTNIKVTQQDLELFESLKNMR